MNGPAVSVGQAAVNSEYEGWQRVHAQLLKSVADAQAKLLAAQNETNDKLTDVVIPVLASLENRLIEAHNNHAMLSGRLEALVDIFRAKRQLKRIQPKRIGGSRSHVKRAVERKR